MEFISCRSLFHAERRLQRLRKGAKSAEKKDLIIPRVKEISRCRERKGIKMS